MGVRSIPLMTGCLESADVGDFERLSCFLLGFLGLMRNNMNKISWSDFEKIELIAGTVVDVQPFPEARKPAYKLVIDFGPEIGQRQSSAQITTHYEAQELIGKQIIGVVNLPKKQIGPFMSECLVTGCYREDESVILVSPTHEVPNGARLG